MPHFVHICINHTDSSNIFPQHLIVLWTMQPLYNAEPLLPHFLIICFLSNFVLQGNSAPWTLHLPIVLFITRTSSTSSVLVRQIKMSLFFKVTFSDFYPAFFVNRRQNNKKLPIFHFKDILFLFYATWMQHQTEAVGCCIKLLATAFHNLYNLFWHF